MSAFIKQNDVNVSKVQPGTPIQLFANDLNIWWNTEFLVVNASGVEYLKETVYPTPMGNAWYDWIAPNDTGQYFFYANSSAPSSNFTTFTVATSAPDPWNQGKTNWWMIGGIAAGVVGIAALVSSFRR